MRFDAYAALAEIKAERRAENARSNNAEVCDNGDTCDTAAVNPPHVAHVAHVARLCVPEKPAPSDPAEDAETLAEHLRINGPASYGATATDLRWPPSRAWLAEATLQAAGRITHDRLGFMMPV